MLTLINDTEVLGINQDEVVEFLFNLKESIARITYKNGHSRTVTEEDAEKLFELYTQIYLS